MLCGAEKIILAIEPLLIPPMTHIVINGTQVYQAGVYTLNHDTLLSKQRCKGQLINTNHAAEHCDQPAHQQV